MLKDEIELRDALRAALPMANRCERFAAYWGNRDRSKLGVWGHIVEALRLMDDDEALERFFETDEWDDMTEETNDAPDRAFTAVRMMDETRTTVGRFAGLHAAEDAVVADRRRIRAESVRAGLVAETRQRRPGEFMELWLTDADGDYVGSYGWSIAFPG